MGGGDNLQVGLFLQKLMKQPDKIALRFRVQAARCRREEAAEVFRGPIWR